MNNTQNKNEFEYSVSEISNSIKQTVELNFEYVHVVGEISSVKTASSGHVYFDLKDSNAVINTIAWKFVAQKLTLFPKEGQEVVVTGKITTYPGRSNYQLIVKDIKQSGQGDIFKIIEQRKQKFKELGYFDESIKKKLPKYPTNIGIITSKTGAVIEDIKHRIFDRFPCEITLYDSAMQGDNCEKEVVAGIKNLKNNKNIDIIIIARGGGSAEDLMPFNGELLCEEIYNCNIPIISAIGHETDFTICDFVSDLRAPTPTAASELCTPNRNDLLMKLQSNLEKCNHIILSRINKLEKTTSKFEISSIGFINKIHNSYEKTKNNKSILNNLFEKQIYTKKSNLQALFSNLINPKHIVELKLKNLDSKYNKLNLVFNQKIQKLETKIAINTTVLKNTSLQKIMAKGFCIIKSNNGEIINDITKLNKDDKITIINNGNTKDAKIID